MNRADLQDLAALGMHYGGVKSVPPYSFHASLRRRASSTGFGRHTMRPSMRHLLSSSRMLLVTVCLTLPASLLAQTVSAAAGSAAGIQPQVAAFRTSLGPLNTNTVGSFGSGRREIDWDGVPNTFASPNGLPGNFFNVTSPRGVLFSTPGSGFALSANAGVAPILFSDIDATYAQTFSAFSAQRIFTAIGSNIVDVRFFVPRTTTAALTLGFGAIFSDVDLAETTSLQFFDGSNASLGTFFAPTGIFSFLGVSFGSSSVGRVRITSGNIALGSGASDQNGVARDVVAMDDFIYAEPTVVPEPGTYGLLGTG